MMRYIKILGLTLLALCTFGAILLLSLSTPGGSFVQGCLVFTIVCAVFLVPSLIFRFVAARTLKGVVVIQSTSDTPPDDKSLTEVRNRKNLILLIMFLLVPASLMGISMLLGGFIFAFDAPVKGIADGISRWITIVLTIVSPIFLFVSLRKLKNGESLKWGWFGVAPILFFFGISYLAPLLI